MRYSSRAFSRLRRIASRRLAGSSTSRASPNCSSQRQFKAVIDSGQTVFNSNACHASLEKVAPRRLGRRQWVKGNGTPPRDNLGSRELSTRRRKNQSSQLDVCSLNGRGCAEQILAADSLATRLSRAGIDACHAGVRDHTIGVPSVRAAEHVNRR